MPPRKRLGQLLTELGVVDEHQLQSALGHQKQWGGKLGAVLVQKGFCKEAEVVSALSKHLGMQAVKLADAKVDARAVKFVSKQIAEKLHVFPYEISGTGRGEVVTIAMSDPTDLSAVDQLAFHTGKRIKPILAGDSEIVQAIHLHYGGDEKAKPADAAAGAPAGAAAPAAPASPAFPKRIGPQAAATPAGGSPRIAPAAPYIPPPIPAQAPKLSQKLEEIEPDESMSVPTPPPPRPDPLEIPEDDGSTMGLEPIAAHSQFGDQVAGSEEVEAGGSAGDAVEGLVSAGVPHEGAAEASQMEGLEPIAAHAQVPAPDGGWGAEATPAAASEGGWGEEAPAAEAAPAEAAPGEWGAASESAEGWGAEQPAAEGEPAAADAAWGAEPAAGAEAGAAEPQAGDGQLSAEGEQLPMDAIIGTAEAPSWGAEAAAETPAEEQPATDEHAAHEEAEQHQEQAHEAEHDHEGDHDHEAAHEAEQHDEHAHEPAEHHDEHEHQHAAATESGSWGEAAQPAEQAWGASETPAEPSVDAPSTDRFAPVSATDELSTAPAAETEAPPEWGQTTEEEPLGASAEAPAHEPAAEEPPQEPAPEPATHEEAPAAESAAAEAAAAESPSEETPPHEDAPFDETPAEPSASEEFAEQGELKLEGWVAPPAEPEPQGAGWLGQALEATTPLSSVDYGTLSSIGVDPNDGVGALRLLAALVRVLNRGQHVDLGEVANEIQDSRAQAAAEQAAADAEAAAAGGSAPEDGQTPAEPAET